MRKTRLIRILAIFITLFLLAASCLAQAEDPVSATKRALKGKNYQEMLAQAQLVIKDYPDWFWGHHWKGRALFGLKKYSQAVTAFELSLDSAEKDDETFMSKYFIVNAYYHSQDYQKCLKAIDSAQRTKKSKYFKSKEAALLSIKGYCHLNLKQYKEAVAAFKPVIDAGKASDQLLKAAGQCYFELNDDRNASRLIQKALKKNPKDLAAHKILVKSLTNDHEWQKALSSAKEALQYYNNDWEINFLAGQACYSINDFQNAKKYLEKSYRIKQQPKTAYCLAKTYNSMENWLDAVKFFNKARQSYSDRADYCINFAYAYLKYVPEDAEKYHQKKKGKEYLNALASAEVLLRNAVNLKGGNKESITRMTAMLTNKRDRLEKGETITEVYEWALNPNTGEWEKKAKVNK